MILQKIILQKLGREHIKHHKNNHFLVSPSTHQKALQWLPMREVGCPICSKSLFRVLNLNFFFNIFKYVIKIKTFETISYPQKKKPKVFLLSKE